MIFHIITNVVYSVFRRRINFIDMNIILLFFITLSTLVAQIGFNEGPYGVEYFDIAGPFELPDLNMELHGDANIDGIINIQDVILIVGNILGNNDFTSSNVQGGIEDEVKISKKNKIKTGCALKFFMGDLAIFVLYNRINN